MYWNEAWKRKKYTKYRLTGHEPKDKERENRRRGGIHKVREGESVEERDWNARQL